MTVWIRIVVVKNDYDADMDGTEVDNDTHDGDDCNMTSTTGMVMALRMVSPSTQAPQRFGMMERTKTTVVKVILTSTEMVMFPMDR